jgi:hypothetical protein
MGWAVTRRRECKRPEPPCHADVDNGVEKTIDCATAKEVSVMGNACHLTLQGACGPLHVDGNANHVGVSGSAVR